MKPLISKVIADGRVTIPKELREKQGIRIGDYVKWRQLDGGLAIHKITSKEAE